MPMMTMLIILVVVYFSTLVFLLIWQKHLNTKYTILIFTIVNILLYAGQWLNDYFQRNSFTFLMFDQISPCMFTMLSLSYFMKDKIKDYFYCTAAFLSFGMLVAMLVSPQDAYLSAYKAEASMLYVIDTLEHLNFSLFGIFLVISGTVKVSLKNLGKSMIFIYSIIIFVVIVNFIFHTNFFGMGYYGNYSIYMISLFESYWATLAAYIFGVFSVLLLGYELGYILLKLNKYNNVENVNSDNLVLYDYKIKEEAEQSKS